MKASSIIQLTQVVSNLGVVAGIIFLAIEIRQNQESLEEANIVNRAAVTSTAVASINDWRAMLLENDELRRAWIAGASGAELSEDDTSRFNLICENALWNLVMSHERAEMLGLPDRAYGAAAAWADSLRSPRVNDCWERGKPAVQRWGYDSFVTAVESYEAE